MSAIEGTQSQSYLQSFGHPCLALSPDRKGDLVQPKSYLQPSILSSPQEAICQIIPKPNLESTDITNQQKQTQPQSYLQPSISPIPQEATPQIVSKKDVKVFGREMFDRASSSFEPMVDASVGPDYIIGSGDNLIVELWGKFENVYNLVVDRDGKVFIPNIGAIQVYGLSFTQLQNLLQDKFSKVYTNFKMNVTLGKLRTIKVFVVGEVTKPGAYTLSSLSTVFNALYAAGGPGIEGSMRNIRLIRENKVINTIDLYKFLLEGDKSQDNRLCAGDTIFVPLRGPMVGVAGEITRPASYELKGSTTITELIRLAGGVKSTGYLHRIQIERLQHHERNTIEDIDLDAMERDKAKDMGVFNGDFVLIFPISEQKYKFVELVGMVLRPGRYELKEKMRVSELLDAGKLLEEAHLEKIDVIRTYKDKRQQVISVNLRDIQGRDLELQEWDRVVVYSSWDMKPRDRVSITGLVKNPGYYDLLENMSVGDIICQAGGITKADEIIHVEIIRTTVSGQVEVIPVDITVVLGGDKNRDISLQQFDHVFVYSVFEPETTPVVMITGLVKSPGTYNFSKEMKVSDLITQAGGLDKGATLLNCELSRMIRSESGVSFIHMPVDLGKAMIGGTNEDILLKEYDNLFIRQIPEWRIVDTVMVAGQVVFPGTYAIAENERLTSVLERAGRFTKDAFLPGAVFIRQSVKEQQEHEIKDRFLAQEEVALAQEETGLANQNLLPEELVKKQEALDNKRKLLRLSMARLPKGRIVLKLARLEKLNNSRNDIILQNGDSLFIPKTPVSVTIIGEVYNPGAILYHHGHRVRNYINNVGGLTKKADKSAIYIIKPDGRVERKGFFGCNAVDMGDIVVVPTRIKTGVNIKDITATIYQLAATIAVMSNVFK
ncbi:SLBB domain-containing protein [Candidatus Desantisbacteria bacterium]|nr:SLBB domain-containing protein [Candidatus Desantisbacteria bacterium]